MVIGMKDSHIVKKSPEATLLHTFSKVKPLSPQEKADLKMRIQQALSIQ